MDPEQRTQALQKMADQICSRILDEDYPDIDIEIAIQNLREQAAVWFPGREELFRMVYESRFERLRQQFRSGIDHID